MHFCCKRQRHLLSDGPWLKQRKPGNPPPRPTPWVVRLSDLLPHASVVPTSAGPAVRGTVDRFWAQEGSAEAGYGGTGLVVPRGWRWLWVGEQRENGNFFCT